LAAIKPARNLQAKAEAEGMEIKSDWKLWAIKAIRSPLWALTGTVIARYQSVHLVMTGRPEMTRTISG